MFYIMTTVIFLLGACLGNVINTAAQRRTLHESRNRRLHCDCCGHTLGVCELIPIASWVLLRGRCRYCGAKMGVQRVVAEFFGGFAFATAFLKFGLSWQTLELIFLFCILMYLALVDLETMELPNLPMFVGLLNWVCFLPAYTEPLSRFLTGLLGGIILGGGMLVLSLIMDRILGRESLGGGDVKLFAMLGLVFGFEYGLLLLILACILGLLFATVFGIQSSIQFPFGPAIAIAALLTVMFGQSVLTWYCSLF